MFKFQKVTKKIKEKRTVEKDDKYKRVKYLFAHYGSIYPVFKGREKIDNGKILNMMEQLKVVEKFVMEYQNVMHIDLNILVIVISMVIFIIKMIITII